MKNRPIGDRVISKINLMSTQRSKTNGACIMRLIETELIIVLE